MTQQARFPDFLIIGAMKSGTTSLHDYLGKHPDIYTSDPKEIHFFMDKNFNKYSLDWYKSLFISDKKIAGTSPQNYTKCHRPAVKNVPERIYKHMPNVKLIYIVRDPVKRIISHYAEAQSGGYAPKQGLSEFLQNFENNHYVQTSRYYYQISQYLKFFKKEQILIIKSEDLLADRLNTLNEVFRFLSVNEIT
ncbi:MAG: sulfotransferase domain-containing protein, partial [Bacteroidales bacterium]|nr:sulfotransferase domain-containing protein [Bacteroidales bacterium]